MSLVQAPRPLLYLAVGVLFAALVAALLPLPNALLVAGALVLGAAFLVYPQVAVYLLVVAVPFGSLLPLSVGGASLTAADGLLALAWALYLARGIARRKIDVIIPPLVLPFVVFILAAAVSITVATSLSDSITELVKWIEMLAAYWLVAQFFDERRLEPLLAVMFLSGLGQALLGAYQYYFRIGPEGFLLFGGANLRAYGTFDQPNPYAGYLGLIIPLAFGTAAGILLAWYRRVTQPRTAPASSRVPFRHFLLLVLAAGSFVAMLAALFFSYSRGAWVAATAALSVAALVILVRSKRAAALALLLALLALIVIGLGEINIVPDIITQRFATVGDYFGFEDVRGVVVNDDNFAIVERWAHWQAAFGMFEDSPWLGVGFGNYADAYPRYALPKWDDPLGHAHNYYLNVLAEAGLVGFIPYIILWIAIFWIAWRTARSLEGWTQGVAAGALGVLVALSIHNFFDNLFVHAMYIQVGLTLGIIEVLHVQAKQLPAQKETTDR